MQIVRIKNSMGINQCITPYLLDETEEERVSFAEELKQLIAYDQLFVMAIIEATDKDVLDKDVIVHGFVVAISHPNTKHAFIHQAWMSPKLVGREMQDIVFFHLTNWAVGQKKTSIRAETTRKTEAFLRKWKFEPFSAILSFKIPEKFKFDVLDDSRREEDGTKESGARDTENLGTKPTTGGDSQSTGGVATTVAESGSSTVHADGTGAAPPASTGATVSRPVPTGAVPVTDTYGVEQVAERGAVNRDKPGVDKTVLPKGDQAALIAKL